MADLLVEQVEALKKRVDILETKHASSAVSNAPRKSPSDESSQVLPKGVVLGKDGKPCRSCSSFASFSAFGKQKASPSASSSTQTLTQRNECPPDVEELGRSAWTVLHTMAANYPTTAAPAEQSQMSQFISLFSQLYPCWVCADDFQSWMRTQENKPRLGSRAEFGRWMCDAHNAVNDKLGKKQFDCTKWEERWKDGWKDGSCD